MVNYSSKCDLIRILKNKAKEIGRKPAVEDFSDVDRKAILSYFKKWDKALKTAGLCCQSKDVMIGTKVVEDGDHVLPEADMAEQDTDEGRIEEPKMPEAPESVASVQASAQEAKSACGNAKQYSKEIITELLLAEYHRLGKKLTRKQIDDNKDLPSCSTCLKYFGTTKIGDLWAEVLGE